MQPTSVVTPRDGVVDGSDVPADIGSAVTDEIRRSLLRHMLLARGVDQEALQLKKQGALDLWLSCQGHEAAQVASALAAGPHTTIFPSYREHAAALARGVPAEELVAQWAGRTFCGWTPDAHAFFPYTLFLAAQTLHAVGYSLGRRLQGLDDAVVVYIGDGATSEGDMSEALNLAAVESAAVLFVCQNNGWAISTPVGAQMRTSLAERARGFGIRSAVVPGTDPEELFSICRRAVQHLRCERAPYLLEIRVGRIHGHSTSDAQELYRTAEDIERTRAADPVPAYTRTLLDRGSVDDGWLRSVDAEVARLRQRLARRYAP